MERMRFRYFGRHCLFYGNSDRGLSYFFLWNVDFQDSIFEAGFDLFGINILREWKGSHETSKRGLLLVKLVAFSLVLFFLFSSEYEGILVDLDFDIIFVTSWKLCSD